jgi:iron complex outermembrane receptor protein
MFAGRVSSFLHAAAVLLMSSAATGALAQTVPAAPAPPETTQATGIGEIIVTAQRKAENIQNVPIAITALSGERLSTSGVSISPEELTHSPKLGASGRVATPSALKIRSLHTLMASTSPP